MSAAPVSDVRSERRRRITELGYDHAVQPRTYIETCGLCGRSDWIYITHVDRYGYDATTTACGTCGFTILNPRMTVEAYGDFYEGVYRPLVSAYHGRLIDARSIKDEQHEYAVSLAELLAPLLAGRDFASLLDIGGSTGVVAAHLAERFQVRPTVLDPAPDEIAEAEGVGMETIRSFVETWEPGSREFDLVGMFQTADHLLDVPSALDKARDVVDGDGLFVMDIVDFRAAYLRNWSVEEATKIDHPHSLTQPVAEALLARSGFEIITRSFSPDHLHVLYVCHPVTPDPMALPSPSWVTRYLDEIRFVQNAPRPGS